jgi:hypothetical protein|tara:strand:- start:792 stop:908 length:117 start_codon:yes stop_codon:yes gene_type:complete
MLAIDYAQSMTDLAYYLLYLGFAIKEKRRMTFATRLLA